MSCFLKIFSQFIARFTLLVLSIALITMGTQAHRPPIVRQNVGVIFQPLETPIVNGYYEERMIIAIPYTLPEPPHPYENVTDRLISMADSQNFLKFPMLLHAKFWDGLNHKVDSDIILAISNIRTMLSDPLDLNLNDRKTRAVLPVVGDVFKDMFGLATEEDLRTFLHIVINLNKVLKELSDDDVDISELLTKMARRQDHMFTTFLTGKYGTQF